MILLRLLCLAFIGLFLSSAIRAGELKLQTQTASVKESLRYWIYLPDDASKAANKSETYPLVLFLHGDGEGGDNPNKVKKHGLTKLIAQGRSYPFILVAPQNPSETQFWDDQMLVRLLDEIESKHPVNRSRVYLTGISRGGYGVWRLAIQNPNRFAALVPVGGGGSLPYMKRIAHLPIWVFHGQQDPVIPISESQRLVDALKAAGGNVKITVYPEAGHDAWTQAYDDPELYRWMLEQKKPKLAK